MAPTVSYTVPVSLQVGVEIARMTPKTLDLDIASCVATSLPAGLFIDRTTGVIGGSTTTSTTPGMSAQRRSGTR